MLPDPRLHKIAQPVAVVDERVRAIVDDMFATMYDASGMGLAATQVDVHERIVVIDVSEARPAAGADQPRDRAGQRRTRMGDEGCLSVPGIYDGVERALAVRMRARSIVTARRA